jgi:hypothetical protein
MKQRFLTVYEYGAGGCWQYFLARSSTEILAKYPKLRVVRDEPDWLKVASETTLREYDIEEEPDSFLQSLAQDGANPSLQPPASSGG